MSEFKYSCPVCGQHIKVDSSQAGTTMECPTCFQKIIVPQAPTSEDQKFIIQGTKVGAERPVPLAAATAETPPPPVPEKPSFLPAILVLVLVGAAAVLWLALHGKGVKPSSTPPPKPGATGTPASPRPAIVAPPANSALWKLDLNDATIPDTPVAGRIHGQDFIVDRANFQNGTLTLRRGSRGPVEFGLTINFSGAMAEALASQTVTISTNTEEAARVTLRWSGDANSGRDSYNTGYAMRLEFGALENNRLPGKIYLCTPDAEQSYLLGTFNAEVRRPKPPKPH